MNNETTDDAASHVFWPRQTQPATLGTIPFAMTIARNQFPLIFSGASDGEDPVQNQKVTQGRPGDLHRARSQTEVRLPFLRPCCESKRAAL